MHFAGECRAAFAGEYRWLSLQGVAGWQFPEAKRSMSIEAPSASNEPPTPKRQTRHDRPRSGSSPPVLRGCDWHGAGNLDNHAAKELILSYSECIEDPSSDGFATWHAHINSVLFFDKPDWSNFICTKIKPYMLRDVAEILVHRQGWKNNRMQDLFRVGRSAISAMEGGLRGRRQDFRIVRLSEDGKTARSADSLIRPRT